MTSTDNTLAYCDTELFTLVKNFMVDATCDKIIILGQVL